ncbi:MAG: ABC transporter ATP-binding protein [Clostridiales bacterium]|nr:ABC transporter ATP-binding protein [Clostridiales bacterium]
MKKENSTIPMRTILKRSLTTIWKYAKPWSIILIALTALAMGLLLGFTPLVTQNFFDLVSEAVNNGYEMRLAILSGLFLGIYTIVTHIVSGLDNIVQHYFTRYTTGLLTELLNLKTGRMDPILFEDPKYLDDMEKGGLGHWRLMFIYILINATVFKYLTQFIVMSWYLFNLQPIFVITPLLVFIPVLLAQFLRTGVFSKLEDESAPIRRETNYFQDCMCTREYFKEIRLLNAFPYFKSLYINALTLYNRAEWKAERRGGLIDMLSKGVSLIGFIIILVLLISSTVSGKISVGAFAAVFAAINAFFASLEELIINRIGYITRNIGLVQNFIRYIDSPERDGEELTCSVTNGITLNSVSFKYPLATEPSVKNVNLFIPTNETLAIVGENGSGKSTLVKLLLGLYLPSSGQVLYDEIDTAKSSPTSLFENSSAVFQEYARYKLTLKENIAISDLENMECGISESMSYFLDPSDDDKTARQVKDILSDMDMEWGNMEGTHTILSKEYGGADLSGGQWQKVAIARGLFRNHKLIALDEPTAAIDPIEETRLYKRFADISRGVTSIIVTHRLGSARIADRIIVMDHGEIVQSGTHEELVKIPGKYSEMWQAQAQYYTPTNKALA